MKNTFKLFFLAVILVGSCVFLFWAILFLTKKFSPSSAGGQKISVSQISFTPERKVYSFGDIMRLNIHFKNFPAGETLQLRFQSLPRTDGTWAVYRARKVVLKKKGDYRIIYSLSLPFYSKCGSIKPGEHYITLTVSKKGKIIFYKKASFILR